MSLKEQVAALESKEVCNAPHDDDVIEGCPYCRVETLTAEIEEWREIVGKVHKIIVGYPHNPDTDPVADIRELLSIRYNNWTGRPKFLETTNGRVVNGQESI